jgi:hypothetical protein
MGFGGEGALAPADALSGALLPARRHQPGKLRSMIGNPAVSAVGEPGEASEHGGWDTPARQQP